ncbi:MAG: 30S ribosomal protein S20 [Alphaproteobacteria bacterium]|jgi:small subunit ribosomal protein S20|nr:30S ribosomal protein S20 [Alphaproteobacteria bacterium]MBT7942786.1 30S ribosomal protein S20 [Alphaproteobacteria bacterium]
MAHSLSAKKRVRRTQRQTAVNVRRLSTVRTSIRKVELAIAAGNKAEAEVALRDAQPEMMRGAQKGVFPGNTMSRKISRLSKQIKGMAA